MDDFDDLPEKIRNRIHPEPDGCWIWIGSMMPSGYGQIEMGTRPDRKTWLAHRLVWSLLVGELPENLHHHCGTKCCVRPSHLAPLTLAEHQREHHLLDETCHSGHPWTEGNTYIRPNGQRQCRACKAERQRQRHASDPVRHNQARTERRRRQQLKD